ncbi:hypothetical protein [uncultured Nostoc sp.]|uniref:hypothetical protein n=1 Tax=uncultured Nostoc sp. TaxID=340711 RepID=UPI0035CAF74C
MLTLDKEHTTALDYSVVNTSIQETLTAIDRFEWQAIDELRLMRDNGYYSDAGYVSFEDYCEKELTKHGGYRRVRDLLSAKKVVDTLPEELQEKITKPSQTRSLLRLVKTPDKLEQAVAIAAKEKPFPTAADFAKAVQEVAPTVKRSTKSEQSQTQLCNSATVSSQLHPRYGESGVIEADPPNR